MSAEAQGYKRRRSAISIMGQLIGLVRPLIPIMLLAIVFGVLGYLCAIFLTIIAGSEILHALLSTPYAPQVGVMEGFNSFLIGAYDFITALAQMSPWPPATDGSWNFEAVSPGIVFAILVVLGVMRGVLHYIEQYCNHYIAFRLLAIIRHKVFAQLRRLSPAKLEGRDSGNLISLITSDIELLEVFYAHTISPICIAIITSAIMVWFIWSQSMIAGIIALVGYLVIGAVVPMIIGHLGSAPGLEFRNGFGELNTFVLDSIRGVDETIQYGGGNKRLDQISERSRDLGAKQEKLNRLEAHQRSFSNLIILLFSLGMMFTMLWLYQSGQIAFANALVATIAMMGSFGPVLALSNLANSLNQTLACGDRVLDLLKEKPQVEEVEQGEKVMFDGAEADDVSFAYDDEQILENFELIVNQGQIVGIHGPSGCGKSTLLKLLMRFWDVESGAIKISGHDIRKIQTSNLRDVESYVTQDTYLFHDSIANNIAVGKPGARRDEIVDAAQKASLDEFVRSLPDGYDTQVGELGDTLSGGERQRIGIARAFLHDAPFLLLDEPTSNLDSLNEGIILKSLQESSGNRTVILVSHRLSTLGMADRIVEMETDRES